MNVNAKRGELLFSVQTLQTTGGGSLRSIKPDKDGVYRGVPLAVIGKPSRNNAFYDQPSFVDSITNPNTRFNKSLVGGGLEGEWGHPLTTGLDARGMIKRTMDIDGTLVSHYFTAVYARKSADGKYYVVYGDVVPFGPYGQYLTEAFADAKRNIAFSLRSITAKPEPTGEGYLRKRIMALITFDAVSTPGFEEASKRYMEVSDESFDAIFDDIESDAVSVEDLIAAEETGAVIGVENITNQALLDMLEVDSVTVTTTEDIAIVRKRIIHGDEAVSAFHKLYK